MKVEVTTPEEYMGSIIGDLNSRRGMVENIAERAGLQIVNAMVPLATMFSYIGSLRSLSKGRASFSMEFGRYERLPENLAAEMSAQKK